ncbi:MAG: aminotransferase class V-fold PLP-dependent enzyme [Verrucomicrobia bacterium]|nr:aminotransferase class V-fold PLP-dependent enzyme [Verrucomicrobiota bacterium]
MVRPKPGGFRRHWQLAPRTVFLNHGSFGACPKPILKLQAGLRAAMEAEPVQFLWRRYEERLEPARQELAHFVGARSKDLVFITNATTGVNAVLRSLKLRRGDEVLTTNLDYNACHNVVAEVARRADAKLVVANVPFPLNAAAEITAAILQSVTPRTRLVLLDHVTSNTALVFPLKPILRELEARGVESLVDGAHAPGMLPLNLRHLRPTYYTANLHKWVCAPKGAAFLWVREDKQATVQPAVISHGHNRPRPGFTRFQDRFDWAGTCDPSAWFCVGEAIRFMGSLLPGGWRELYQRNHDLAVTAQRMLCQRLLLEPPCPASLLGSMATIPLPAGLQHGPASGKIDREQLRLYDEFGIEVPLMRFGQPPRRWLRVSAQVYNSPAEYEYLGAALEQLCD